MCVVFPPTSRRGGRKHFPLCFVRRDAIICVCFLHLSDADSNKAIALTVAKFIFPRSQVQPGNQKREVLPPVVQDNRKRGTTLFCPYMLRCVKFYKLPRKKTEKTLSVTSNLFPLGSVPKSYSLLLQDTPNTGLVR